MLDLDRTSQLAAVRRLIRSRPVTMLLGARQVGKTALARAIVESTKGPTRVFDLENPVDLARLSEPMVTLEKSRGLVVIDEVQHQPSIFPILRVLADRKPAPARFLLLGSASFDLIRQGSETLAGRVGFHELSGFDLSEVGAAAHERLWIRGSFPRSFLARTESDSASWRRDFVRTFLERDLPSFGAAMPPRSMGRFWTMLAHWHGQIWNGSEFGRAFGISHTAVRKYLDLLVATFAVRQLMPWFENVGKRVVKAPKIYIRDSGLLHTLLGLDHEEAVLNHPKVGASFEGFAITMLLARLGVRENEAFFWATHAGAELDLLVVRGQKRLGFEIKRTSMPKVTPSMRSAIDSLKLDELAVVHAGRESFDLADGIRAIAIGDLLTEVRPLR